MAIYCLRDGDGPPRYIGRTKQRLNARLSQHRNDARYLSFWPDRPVAVWMAEIGDRARIQLIEECTEKQAIRREAFWIDCGLKLGLDLLNVRHRGA